MDKNEFTSEDFDIMPVVEYIRLCVDVDEMKGVLTENAGRKDISDFYRERITETISDLMDDYVYDNHLPENWFEIAGVDEFDIFNMLFKS